MCFVWAELKKNKNDGHDSPVCSSTFYLWVLPFGFWPYSSMISAWWFLPAIKVCDHRFSLSNTHSNTLPRYPYTLTVFKVDLSRSSPYLNVKLEFKLKTTGVRVQGVFFWTYWKRHTTRLICKTEFKLPGLQPWQSFGSAFKNPNGILEPKDTEVLPQKYPSS